MEEFAVVLEVLKFIVLIGGSVLMAIFGAYLTVMIYDEIKAVGGIKHVPRAIWLYFELIQQKPKWRKARADGRHRLAAGKRTVTEVFARLKSEREYEEAEWMGHFENFYREFQARPLSLVHAT